METNNFDQIIEKIKNDSREKHIPILMDDTLEVIEKNIKNQIENQIKNNIEIKDENYTYRILEIGTAVGYSASRFVNMVGDNVFVDTIERNEEMFNEAEKNIEKLGLKEKIEIHFGDAKEIVPLIVKRVLELNDEKEKYDMIFIDAAKSGYPFYLTEGLKILKKNGILFADNVLYKGYVMSDYNKHKQRTAVRHLREFIDISTNNEKLDTEILEVGDGLAIIRFK